MPDNIRVIQYGLGPIGSAVARHVVERSGIDLVGGVDNDPDKVGPDVGDVIGLDHSLGFTTAGTLAASLEQVGAAADVVMHTTSSYFDLFKDQVLEILDAGLDIVSTAEELSFPWLSHADEAAEVDGAAKRAGKTVLGTGVNPGFLMDALPLFLTAICQQVDRIAVTRVIDASARRGPFQAKIGSGLDVAPGEVKGLKQVARAYSEAGEFLTLTFIAALEAGDDGDTITITGRPDLEVKLKGTNGDIATVAIAVNAIRNVQEAAPGLVTMRDMAIVTNW
jgi:4-hydroxy-tetrahydrodipicolinate reductase